MAYEIVLAPEAVEDLRALRANVRATVRTALETHLRHEPGKASRSRIKWPPRTPPAAISAEGWRRPVFYDVSGSMVEILAIVTKSETKACLRQFGDPT